MDPLEPTEMKRRDDPGGPLAKASPSNARGVDSIPDQGAEIPHSSWSKKPNIKKKKKQSNGAEKHKHLSKGNFDIQVKSFRPKDTSCFFKHSLLVAFRGTKVQLETKLWKITQTAALSQYFPNIILRENNIITKAAIIQLHCLCRWLLGPVSPCRQSPVTQSMLRCLSNNFLENKNCWKMKFKTGYKLSYAEKSSSTGP